ncbi:hypothetical protein [Thiomicrorhabdus sp.]|uniref:hypothetical protein n=1 Tax=Thiomicrorhabdus sp. TaxID=2039724 RepID=UPI0029C64C4E|nr:hypothetical protein [Thiomicrorhabdus sp.]
MTIFIKDDLRASVEAATGGLCTVFYTEKNQPTFMRMIPKFNLQDIDASLGTGVHPAFVVNGQEVDAIHVGMYQGIRKNGELLSLPGVLPSVSAPYTTFLNEARSCGAGFGLTTNAMYAAISLWIAKHGTEPRGNTNWGRSHLMTYETGVRPDSGAPGAATGDGKTLTGSGPLSWRHDGSVAGIADYVGNCWEFSPGMRIVDGEIQVIADNNAITLGDFGDSAPWRAILQDGTLVNPGTANTLKYSSNNGVEIITGIDSTKASVSKVFSTVAAASGVTIPAIMKALMLAPSLLSSGTLYVNDDGQRYPLRLGRFHDAGGAGPGALSLYNPASAASSTICARPAKV